MDKTIKSDCRKCKLCNRNKVQRHTLAAEFEQAEKNDLPLPRQTYGIDLYGHEKGEILVAIDLCTREINLWFLPNKKQENIAKALLSGLIFQKGVPLLFRSDEAPELVQGVVDAMNAYLGIKQITTGGHNPRSNATAERVMQHLNACLRKCDDTQYRNMQDYLPAIAFAHNTAFNSAINCTPFEAGHGLKARTITEARASPRMQIIAKEGNEGLQEPTSAWETSVFQKVCKFAERLADEAQRQSQWHKRMTAHRLNQSGRKISDRPLKKGDKVYFYKPPTREEILRRGRKAKHLAHYQGPATVQGRVSERKRQFQLSFEGKIFKRDIGMIIPEQQMKSINIDTHDVTKDREKSQDPKLFQQGMKLNEEDLIICKTEIDDQNWYLAEIAKIYPDEIDIIYYTTPLEGMKNYESSTLEQRAELLKQARFRKTWYIRNGKNAGKGTTCAPFPKNPELRLWEGKLPTNELNKLILASNMQISPKGFLSNKSISLAKTLAIGHQATATVDDTVDESSAQEATHALFAYAETTLCNCTECNNCLSYDRIERRAPSDN